VDVAQLVDWLDSLPELRGLTVTGGEPFQQADGVRALLAEVRDRAGRQGRTVDILTYSGYTYGALTRRNGAAALLALCDAVITGPYIDRLNPGGSWRGSANQKLILLSELGRERFGGADASPAREQRLQFSSDGQRLWLIGVPGRGDLDHLKRELMSRGVSTGGDSWHD
jgi:anaerobic ribonucleoside-triphosphate reductase activating protein